MIRLISSVSSKKEEEEREKKKMNEAKVASSCWLFCWRDGRAMVLRRGDIYVEERYKIGWQFAGAFPGAFSRSSLAPSGERRRVVIPSP